MKYQTRSNWQISLQMLGCVGLIFFTMAFACRNDKDHTTDTKRDGDTTIKQTKTTSNGSCSTEKEFKEIITSEKMSARADTDEDVRVDFNSFDMEGPVHYQNSQEYYFTNTDNAYRVTTDFDVIFRNDNLGKGKIFRERYENVVLMCYTVTSKNTCVCFGEQNYSYNKARRDEVTEQY